MEWVEDFEVGLLDIDTQHRGIFLLIQRIHAAREPNSRSYISDALIELEQATRAHFNYEERLMVTADYSELNNHIAEHAKLLLEIQSYKDNAVFSTRQLTQVLFNWLTSHIMMADRQLAAHILHLSTSTSGLIAATDIARAG